MSLLDRYSDFVQERGKKTKVALVGAGQMGQGIVTQINKMPDTDLVLIVDKNENKQILIIDLKYNSGSPVISVIERVSKPGRRVFSSAQSLPKINNGLGIAIISTPKGVMTDIDARKQKVGGEIICKVF